MVENEAVRIIDASTAHRTHPDWTYGFPEMTKHQRNAIASARFVANPGCYPTAFIALVRPLLEADLLSRDWPVSVSAVSGYTGGGTADDRGIRGRNVQRIYASAMPGLRAVMRAQACAGNENPHRAGTCPAVYAGRRQLRPWHDRGSAAVAASLPGKPGLSDLHAVLAEAYDGEHFIEVATQGEASSLRTLAPEDLNGTNRMKLYVFGSETGQARLVAHSTISTTWLIMPSSYARAGP